MTPPTGHADLPVSAEFSRNRDDRSRLGQDRREEPLITAAEVAALVGVSPSTVLDWHQAGEIPSFKFGHGNRAPVRFRRSEILDWIESKRSARG